MKKYRNIKSIILPNNKLNIFIVSILFLGIIAGAIAGAVMLAVLLPVAAIVVDRAEM